MDIVCEVLIVHITSRLQTVRTMLPCVSSGSTHRSRRFRMKISIPFVCFSVKDRVKFMLCPSSRASYESVRIVLFCFSLYLLLTLIFATAFAVTILFSSRDITAIWDILFVIVQYIQLSRCVFVCSCVCVLRDVSLFFFLAVVVVVVMLLDCMR